MVEVLNLTKSYESFIAVDNISFTVSNGDIFAIMGPNGAGKSTTLESILSIKKPDSGIIKVLDMDLVKNKELFEDIGVQFQESNFQSAIKVKEICELTASFYKKKINWMDKIEKSDFAKNLNKSVSNLSGGEKQKLSILLATIHSPKLLFLDELTTGLDPIARRETWDFIKELNKDTTIILTSHFMDEVEYLCNRGIVLVDGKIKSQGSISDIILSGKGQNLDEAYVNIIKGAM